MSSDLIELGELPPFSNRPFVLGEIYEDCEIFLLIHPSQLEAAKEILDDHIKAKYKPIDYKIYTVTIGDEKLLAVRSADPKFHFWQPEVQLLQNAAIPAHVIDVRVDGMMGRSIEDMIRTQEKQLGISDEAIMQRLKPKDSSGALESLKLKK